jgi:hypothetical protein
MKKRKATSELINEPKTVKVEEEDSGWGIFPLEILLKILQYRTAALMNDRNKQLIYQQNQLKYNTVVGHLLMKTTEIANEIEQRNQTVERLRFAALTIADSKNHDKQPRDKLMKKVIRQYPIDNWTSMAGNQRRIRHHNRKIRGGRIDVWSIRSPESFNFYEGLLGSKVRTPVEPDVAHRRLFTPVLSQLLYQVRNGKGIFRK